MPTTASLKIAILSDLHLDIRRRHLLREGHTEEKTGARMLELQRSVSEAAVEADLVVLAGDICEGVTGIEWGAETFAGKPVMYVSGNHEFYRHEYWALLRRLREAGGRTANVRFLENDCVALELRGTSLRILGCMLWTDYRLYGEALAGDSMARAASFLLDHQRIRWHGDGLFQPDNALALHEASRAWLAEELAKPWHGVTMVITHHAPSGLSTAPQFRGDSLSPAFASDLSALMRASAPALWVHGHTHHNVDYRIGPTRVVAHQWGYPKENLATDVKIVTIY